MELQEHLEPERVGELVELYDHAWWAAHRDAAGVERMLAGTDLVLALIDRAADRLVGFARALTDWRYRAYVYDVIVAPDWRDRGLGRVLVAALLARLHAVETIELSCQPEMIPSTAAGGSGTRSAARCSCAAHRPRPEHDVERGFRGNGDRGAKRVQRFRPLARVSWQSRAAHPRLRRNPASSLTLPGGDRCLRNRFC